MRNVRRVLLHVLLVTSVMAFTTTVAGQATPPTFSGLVVTASVSYTAPTYTYAYCVTNPGSNGLNVWDVVLSVAPLVQGANLGIVGPSGWMTDVDAKSLASWTTIQPAQPFAPGIQVCGLGLTSTAPPSVRNLAIQPWLDDYLQALYQQVDASGGYLDEDQQYEIEKGYTFRTRTLGPTGATLGSNSHWNTFQADVATAATLGWLSDSQLTATIQTNLTAARQAIIARNPTAAKAALQAIVDAINGSTPAQRTNEGYALVLYNAQYLRDHLPPPCEPKLSLAPDGTTQPLGGAFTATATLVNLGDGTPFVGWTVWIKILNGPNAGKVGYSRTDQTGSLSFTYTGTKLGLDHLRADTGTGPAIVTPNAGGTPTCDALGQYSPIIGVTWDGGANLAVTSFFPPLIKKAGGDAIAVNETTQNLGNAAAGASVTRYYLSASTPIDPTTARVLGERAVPALGPGESSPVSGTVLTIPADLPAGMYNLGACANANGAVTDTNPANDCSFSKLAVTRDVMVAVEQVILQPPSITKSFSPKTIQTTAGSGVTVSTNINAVTI